jgi:F-type H+-transporting ATPase subunit delta
MASLRIARRYATALLELAAEAGVHERIYEELQGVAAVLRASGELRAVLRNPVIRTERKRAILEELFAGRVSELLLQFLRLLVEKRREPLLPDIIVAYEELFFEHTNRLAVIARSAIPLDEELQERVIQILSERTGKQVLLRPEVRPELLGGLQIQDKEHDYAHRIVETGCSHRHRARSARRLLGMEPILAGDDEDAELERGSPPHRQARHQQTTMELLQPRARGAARPTTGRRD